MDHHQDVVSSLQDMLCTGWFLGIHISCIAIWVVRFMLHNSTSDTALIILQSNTSMNMALRSWKCLPITEDTVFCDMFWTCWYGQPAEPYSLKSYSNMTVLLRYRSSSNGPAGCPTCSINDHESVDNCNICSTISIFYWISLFHLVKVKSLSIISDF
jgi:hypothetical protein